MLHITHLVNADKLGFTDIFIPGQVNYLDIGMIASSNLLAGLAISAGRFRRLTVHGLRQIERHRHLAHAGWANQHIGMSERALLQATL